MRSGIDVLHYMTYLEIINTLEANRKLVIQNPKCEPQLGKSGLYDLKGENNDAKDFQMALLWVLAGYLQDVEYEI